VLAVKNLPTNVGQARDTGSVPRLGRSPGIAVYLPGKFQGQRSLAGYSSLGYKELDTNETLFPLHTHIVTPLPLPKRNGIVALLTSGCFCHHFF